MLFILSRVYLRCTSYNDDLEIQTLFTQYYGRGVITILKHLNPKPNQNIREKIIGVTSSIIGTNAHNYSHQIKILY